ncbi:MAG: DUF5317 domain-containing protein [Chloroflexi bacterium]|nr:DUF5317 domain-containing protein [Chloroflexota bacterium]
MLLLLASPLAILLALLQGGKLARLGELQLRYPGLFIVALCLQIMLFTPFAAGLLARNLVSVFYIFSMFILVGTAWLNRKIPGMGLAGLGITLNLLAIIANGGRMPVDPNALAFSGHVLSLGPDGQPLNNSTLGAHVALWPLTDILAIPAGWPLANVFSIGDVLLAAGVFFLVWRVMTIPLITEELPDFP